MVDDREFRLPYLDSATSCLYRSPFIFAGKREKNFFADQCNRRLLSIKCACAHVCETEMDRHGVERIAEAAEPNLGQVSSRQ